MTLSFIIGVALLGPLGAAVQSVLYGVDDRLFISQSESEVFKKLAASTAAQIKNKHLTLSDDGLSYSIKNLKLKDGFRNVCEDETFAHDISISVCSGFLVGPDLLVTAGHCMRSESKCADTKWVFNYKMTQLEESSVVAASGVYSCKKIINQELNPLSGNDFALVQLERPVEGRAPLKFRTEGRIEDVAPLVMIGHPTGLPSVIADDAYVRENDNDFYFRANLDSFGGNSGSAVFNRETGVVEGLLVRGDKDFVFDEELKCNRVFRCEMDGCRGEDIIRITVIPELAPGMTPKDPVPMEGPPDFPWLRRLPLIDEQISRL